MKKRQLGSSDLYISEIGLGGMSLPTNKETTAGIIDLALDAGINYIDTADLYDFGLNEEIIGATLGKRRQDVILATKVGNRFEQDVPGWKWDPSPTYIKKAVHASLKRLGTDYIDLYQLHGGTIDDPWDDIITTFDDLKKEGLIREYGISSIRPNVLKHFLPASEATSVMMQYSVLDRRPEEWFKWIVSEHASIVTRGTLAKGLLTGSWKNRWDDGKIYGSYDNNTLRETLEKLDKSYTDLHALALAFNLNETGISSTVIGASSKVQLQQTLDAYEKALQIEDVSIAKSITLEEQYIEYR